MSAVVGVAELRQNLSRYLRRMERGERLVVTDPNRPVAELGPAASTGAALDRLLGAIATALVDRDLLADAGALPQPALRTLDAIHVACALSLSPLDAFVSYDERQCATARLSGLRTVTPTPPMDDASEPEQR